jgi:hypothetical protein
VARNGSALLALISSNDILEDEEDEEEEDEDEDDDDDDDEVVRMGTVDSVDIIKRFGEGVLVDGEDGEVGEDDLLNIGIVLIVVGDWCEAASV